MLDFENLTPHGFCLAWDPALIWLQALSDLAIAAAYYSIPLALVRFARLRRDLAFPWIFRLFAAFILACGTTHVLSVVTLWYPIYWTDGLLKLITALLSITTAAVLWPLLPKALSIPSQQQLRELNQRLSVEVAERRAIADRLRASEARLQSIYARTPAPLHAADMEGRLVQVSDQWLDLLGYDREGVIGKTLADFHAPGEAGRMQRDWETLLQLGSVRDQEQTLRRQDGSVRHVLTSSTIEQDADGVTLAVSALTDVTERRATEAALQASEAHLRQAQKMEAVGQLTGGIAHDFNNMLTAVNCVMELLQKRLPERHESRHLVSSVLEASARAAKLTSQLLAFSRRQRLVPEPLDALEVAADMGPLLTRSLGEHVRLEVVPPGDDPWLCLADRNQFESALLNLVLNARAAIDGEGVITISAVQVPDGDAAIAEMQPGEDPLMPRDYVAVTVADTGRGMSEETRQHAFEPFFTTKPVGQGTGLGLSQTYGFARQSGGTVRIDSAPAAGTRVTIILPRAREGVAAKAPPAPPPERSGNDEAVLLVEDEDTLRSVVAAALGECGYRVTAACNADEALALLDQGAAPDILFTDVMMPGSRNGVELALEVRRRRPGVRVLFATGYSDRSVMERWAGRLDVLAKPYSIDAVARAIAGLPRAGAA